MIQGILGGLLSIYDDTKNPEVLAKAIDFGDRLLPAFDSPTGMPYHSVNLKTGKTAGNHGEGRGDFINGETGEWTNDWSYLQAGVDSYYEYMFKSNLLFPDPEIEEMWNYSLSKINEYLAEDFEGKRFYACVNMHTGEIVKRSISLYDEFFLAV